MPRTKYLSGMEGLMPRLSIVVPLYNEEENVEPLYQAVAAALDGTAPEYELLLVDDGSRDRTWERCQEVARMDRRVRPIRFRANYGQTPAMAAGIDHATGEVIVTMDGDLQNDPRDIPMLVAKLDEGYDLAVGWRFDRQDKLISRKVPSRIANWLIGKVTGVPIKDNGCSLKAYRADVIKNVPLYSEMHRFIPAMARISGARVAEVKVRHHARRFGVSKYGLSRTWRVLMDLIAIKTLSQAVQSPMRWFAMFALPLLLAGVALLGAAIVQLALRDAASVVVLAGSGILLCSGALMLIMSGVLSELVLTTGDLHPQQLSAFTSRWR
jgi:glycosyltransferase involved in cell wall biosynthesis